MGDFGEFWKANLTRGPIIGFPPSLVTKNRTFNLIVSAHEKKAYVFRIIVHEQTMDTITQNRLKAIKA